MADGIVIKIRGDDSPLRKTLSGIGKTASGALKGITAISGALSAAWGIAGAATVKYNGTIEQLQTSFEVMTGSAEEAASIVERLKTMGAETPFETLDLAETTQLLMNYGLTADDAISKMSMLGDISQGSADKLQRIATAYGQMSSAGKVSLEDVKQMIEAGFNPLQEISESTGESMASLYNRISAGTLAIDEITASMERSTSAGGKYFQSMEKQSQTLNGRLSTLKDNAQSLLGNIFQSGTDALRDEVLPMATDIVDQLNAGFEAGGIDGLVNALNAQLPKLISWGADAAKNLIGGISSKLPSMVKSLMSSLPNLLGAATELIPQLTTATFGVVSSVVENLIAQLPELLPMLVQGIGSLLSSALFGAFDIIRGIGDGFGTMLKKIGLLEWSPEEIVENAFANVDRDHVEEIKAKINITPDVEVEEPDFELNSLYSEIEKTLTDGLKDTPKIVDDLKRKVSEYYTNQINNVNEWREQAIANLDSTLPTEEYNAAVDEINAKADAMVAGLEQASSATITWIETNAGRSTAAVQATVGDLYAIRDEALLVSEDINKLTGQAQTAMDKQRQVVAAGASGDEGVMASALIYSAQEYAKAMEEANRIKEDALQAALEQYDGDADAYAQAEKEIDAQYEASTKGALEAYRANLQSLIQGISKSLSPDQLAALEPYIVTEKLAGNLEGLNQAILGLVKDNKLDLTDAAAVRQTIVEQLGENLGLSDSDWATIAESMGMDAETAMGKVMDNLIQLLQLPEERRLQSGYNLLDSLNLFQALDTDSLNQLTETIAPVIQAAIESGAIEGVEGADLTSSETILAMLLGSFGDESEVTIGVSPEVEVEDPEVSNPEGAREEVESATESALTESGEPVTVEQDVTAKANVTTDVTTGEESGIQQAVEEKIQQQTLGVDVAANVSLSVNVSDSNATEVGVSAGQEIGNGIVTGLSGKSAAVTVASSAVAGGATTGICGAYQQYYSAGQYLGTGLANGIASKRSAVMAQARSIANAAAAAIRSTLQISSPSKVTTQLGEYTGEGFEIGLTSSMTKAVESAQRIAGNLNLAPRMEFPDVSGALAGAVDSIYGAESDRTVRLYINGREMASTTAADTRVAQAARARRIALGVGRKQ